MDAESLVPGLQTTSRFALSTKQWLYLCLVQGVGSAVLDGGINFGLATAMYRNSPTPTTVWRLPGTLAGDAAVTIMVQVTLTWIIAGVLVRKDVQRGLVEPCSWTPTKASWTNYFFFGGDFDFVSPGNSRRLYRLLLSAVRGGLFAALVGIFVWPLTLAYLVGVFGNDGIIPNWPTPQIFKGVFAAVLGLLTTPIVAALALIEANRAAAPTLPFSSVLPTAGTEVTPKKDLLNGTAQPSDSVVDVPARVAQEEGTIER